MGKPGAGQRKAKEILRLLKRGRGPQLTPAERRHLHGIASGG